MQLNFAMLVQAAIIFMLASAMFYMLRELLRQIKAISSIKWLDWAICSHFSYAPSYLNCWLLTQK
jgi:hypothetical protein